jgi:hypothetical protein
MACQGGRRTAKGKSDSVIRYIVTSAKRSELGSRDIDHTTRGARVRERGAIESIRPSVYAVLRRDKLADQRRN